MPEQLTFELAPPEPPAFANFLAGRNQEAVDALTRAAAGSLREPCVLVWGPAGTGRSHLLSATVGAAQAAGRRARYVAAPSLLDAAAVASDAAHESSPAGASGVPPLLVAVDDVDMASPEDQGRLFTLYNALAAAGGTLVVAALAPPARLDLRSDLRTRLGYGLVYEVVALDDAAKPAALARHARARGLPLGEDVIAWLLAHYPRDMPSLLRVVAALDRHSLATKRALTLPFVRETLRGGNGA